MKGVNMAEIVLEKLIGSSKEEFLSEWQKEEQKLNECIEVIQKNIDDYTVKLKEISDETKELYDHYRSDNPELHNDLVIGLNMQSNIEKTLNKNLLAFKKPYFGRIDYVEHDENKMLCLYIGKHGISKSPTDIMIVDWRAPVSSVYYDSDVGESSYYSPFGEEINITLNLKRTFEIQNSKLIDFYDTDVIANDEFLTKYLGKNKEVVLGEIIATIQKEQNEIIRDTPWHSVIVQGVAGSGKTTVAMHRISYILYNYKDKFKSDEFYIIGSNKMLLNYITGVLPSLDVYNIHQMTLEELFITLLGKQFNMKKGKYTLTNSFTKLRERPQSETTAILKRFKGSIDYIRALENYILEYEANVFSTQSFIYHDRVLYSSEDIKSYLSVVKYKPLIEKIELLNKRLLNKIRVQNERENQEKDIIKKELKKYKDYFGNKKMKIDLWEVYRDFILDLVNHKNEYFEKNILVPNSDIIKELLLSIDHKEIDLYDLGMLTYIKRRLLVSDDFEYVSHIIVDEAQDFGVSIFYILKQLFDNCTYTIMGDITQNIHYDTGMNDWETLKEEVFSLEKDKFYVLAKSYRNTVEISNYASNVLRHCTFKTYDIEPIIRHGKEIEVIKLKNVNDMVQNTVKLIKQMQQEGYTTISIICRTMDETREVNSLLRKFLDLEELKENMEDMNFSNGVMVLPIHMTKGLEFDGVILWNPDKIRYQKTDADAKLLYVAITRALHELHVVYQGELSELLGGVSGTP